MSDSASRGITIAITPMHQTGEGQWETGPRQGARFLLVELIRDDGEDAEVVVECRDERTAAVAARVAAGTLAALGLVEEAEEPMARIDAFDEETAAILADHPTPEIEAPAGAWRAEEEGDDEAAPGRLPS